MYLAVKFEKCLCENPKRPYFHIQTVKKIDLFLSLKTYPFLLSEENNH